MTFSQAIEQYMTDMQAAGRINSARTERSYRDILGAHAEDVGNRDPRTVGRTDCKRTLARWPNPNTQRGRRSVLVSFYRWAVEEGIRKDNPAEQTRRPRKRPTNVYRLTRTEATALLVAAKPGLERRAVYLGMCAGLRSAELRGLKGLHFERPGFVWVSPDIAKGGRERWVPIIGDLAPIADDIVATVAPAHYVLNARANINPPFNTKSRPIPDRPMGGATLWRLVRDVALRAGIVAHIHPHLLRHAFGDHIAKRTGLNVARELMGHADVSTTQIYTGSSSLDELAQAVANVSFLAPFGYPPHEGHRTPHVETVGIEPTLQTDRSTMRRSGPSPPQGDP